MTKKSAKTKVEPKGKAKAGNGAAAEAGADPNGVSKPGKKLSAKDYDRELKKLHVELVKLQQWVVHKGLKVCILFEGRDGAGKGGTIKAITERVSPRVFRVIALPAPTEREKSQMYAQRYLPHLPAAGEIVIFDRSWYNRAGVERVMGFCSEDQARGFLKVVPLFERLMIDSGVILLKYWLEVSPEEQTRRLKARIGDGRKTWKLSPMDVKSYDRWDDYTKARDEMFAATDSSWAPWFVARSEDKKRVRLNVISHLLEARAVQGRPGAEGQAAAAQDRPLQGQGPSGQVRAGTVLITVGAGRMKPHPTEATAVQSGAGAIRFDIVAGLTAAAVVLPKAMAYATVAGLPVAIGLYTAFIPMVVYALLGSSRVLSVSSTTTLAILAGTQLGLVVPDGDPAKLVTATATLAALVGAMLVLARLMKLGFVANFISTPVLTGFKAGIGLVIVLDQVPKLLGIHIAKQGFFVDLLSVAQHVPDTSLLTLAVAVATFAVLIGMERLWPHSPAPLVAVGGAHRRVVVLRPAGTGGLDGRPDSARIPVAHAAGPCADRAIGAGRAGDRADELYRDDRGGPRFCPPGRPSDQREPRTDRHRGGQPRRRAVRRDAGRRGHVADGGGARGGRAVAEGVAGDRRRRGGDDAAARAGAGPDAARDARGGRHRLFGRADPARGVPGDPRRAHDGVSLGADRLCSACWCSVRSRASWWRSSCR